MSSSNNKLDKTGLAYFWNKASAYIQETIEYAQQLWVKIGNTSMGTTATTITGAIAEHETDISNLNSNVDVLSTVSDVTASLEALNFAGASRLYAKKCGHILLVYGYIYPNSDINENTKIGTVSQSILAESFASPVGSASGNTRLKISTGGNIIAEKAIQKSQWYSFEFVAFC